MRLEELPRNFFLTYSEQLFISAVFQILNSWYEPLQYQLQTFQPAPNKNPFYFLLSWYVYLNILLLYIIKPYSLVVTAASGNFLPSIEKPFLISGL